MQVAKQTAVTMSLDSLMVAKQLSDTANTHGVEIGVLAEVDVGLGRVGVAPGADPGRRENHGGYDAHRECRRYAT